MKKLKNRSKILIFSFFISACSTVQQDSNSEGYLDKIEAVKIGLSKDAVINILGKASKVKGENWIYYSAGTGPQRSAVSFDHDKQVVVSATFLPFSEEKEEKLSFILNEKFKKFSFQKIPLLICEQHYVPAKTFYISPDNGIVIEYDETLKAVESITWTSSLRAKK